jgi:hypothetical protein
MTTCDACNVHSDIITIYKHMEGSRLVFQGPNVSSVAKTECALEYNPCQ